MSERGTLFQDPAKLLWSEISQSLRFIDFGFSPAQQASIDNAMQLLIAQRFYDVVYHVLDHVEEVHNPEAIMENSPRLAKWPET